MSIIHRKPYFLYAWDLIELLGNLEIHLTQVTIYITAAQIGHLRPVLSGEL